MKPNFVLILMDDLGWKDVGCCGSEYYETPHIDRLAAEGMRFTQAYASCPVCSPSRASIMTGKYPARVGVTNYIGGNSRGRLIDAPYTRYLPLEERSLARALKDGGYVDLVNEYGGLTAYSYIYYGQAGYLDHALANGSLHHQVTGVTVWHINTDEPKVLDYNTEYKSAGQIISYYSDDTYRASDHDPVVVGLNLLVRPSYLPIVMKN